MPNWHLEKIYPLTFPPNNADFLHLTDPRCYQSLLFFKKLGNTKQNHVFGLIHMILITQVCIAHL